ncbi:methyladenine DNA glycosylase [Legionella gratiana]|uniref:Putative 3-methyladenine DNA glycosylase n=1 Tax=Legionella gratiana TaxID=45066 RepID=A0A378JEH7_9GAMM|nr:DNA-3-methyladenine glycosylase [Legionella gratiana]KTD06182.1 methyladenine DNA glycosylase [Legionella gratiana]STX43030.1 methyladenine DNA glycosylase [Legionella gratiana]
MFRKLPRSFYERNTITVAKDLLGKYLIHDREGIEYIGKIVEVEAYLGQHDLASHSSKGLTSRTKVMFGPAGYAYIYLIYGMYYCTNIVTETEGTGSAILLRALEPIKNIQGKTQGPGLLSKAMHIDKQLNQHDLTSDTFYIAELEEHQMFTIVEKPRIGVHYAKDWAEKLLRFYIKENTFISKP